ncbi:MAG TPA: hypothetical protein VLE43_19590 [Candidatus Saccharimonadia bacterium]|nr:hypothetical protein [Candidatus Saccharimonadia bacterium]
MSSFTAKPSHDSRKSSWGIPLAIGFVVSSVWILSQASFASLGNAPGYDQSSALLIGTAGLMYMTRRRRRLRQ